MLRSRPGLPRGHGEILSEPPFDEWAQLAEENASHAAGWDFTVGGVPVSVARDEARREFVAAAVHYSERIGVPLTPVSEAPDRIALTGHQPLLYHPGVWIKDFLLQRFCDETGAVGVDLVVDTDSFDAISFTAPCLSPEVRKCSISLAAGGKDVCFACALVPSAAEIERFAASGADALSGLPTPALGHHFDNFCESLRSSADDTDNLGDLMTFARRRYEAVSGTDYLEIPATRMGRTQSFLRFVAEMALRAREFAECYNHELQAYRIAGRIRTSAQPFPDLAVGDESVELPLWVIEAAGRRTLSVSREGDGLAFHADGERLFDSAADPAEVMRTFEGLTATLAPKALTLTLYVRLFIADLFIHGVGGGRYDHVTNGVMRGFFGVQAPRYAVASMTMYLPLGAHIVGDEEIAQAKQDLHRAEHNPDALLGEVEFDTEVESARATALAEEKGKLVREIGEPGANKKMLGERIRAINVELAAIMAPLVTEFRVRLSSLENQQAATAILTDREYPYCLWSPAEIQDKAR